MVSSNDIFCPLSIFIFLFYNDLKKQMGQNIFLKKGNKINPLIGNAGVSAVPDSARISQVIGLEYDSTNYLLMHAMGPNVAGVIGSAVAAGILLGFLM